MESGIKKIENVAVRNGRKKLMMLAILAMGTATVANAQTPKEVAVKKDLKMLEQKEILVKGEEKNDKKNYEQKISDVRHEKQNVKRELNLLEAMDARQGSKAQFTRDFGTITNVEWKKIKGLDKGTFAREGKTMSAYYDNSSKLVGTTTIKAFADLPVEAKKAINKDYKGYVTKEVVFFDDNVDNDTNMIMYDLPFEDADSYFVQLAKGSKNIAVQVSLDGSIRYFTDLK